LIAENQIDQVFSAAVIAEMAKDIKAPPDAVTRFEDNVRAAARGYFAERARTNWKAITKSIKGLNGLADKAYHGSEDAAAALADRIGSLDQNVRRWLDWCTRRQLPFPSPREIKDPGTRKQAISRLLSILSYGQKQAPGRKRPGGKQSRTTIHSLRVPTISPGRPGDLAARELVQQLALAYLEATGRSPPQCVSISSPGPFFRLVRRCFRLIQIPDGYVANLINEREERRNQHQCEHSWRSSHYGLSEP
jgi:hypothetical protein